MTEQNTPYKVTKALIQGETVYILPLFRPTKKEVQEGLHRVMLTTDNPVIVLAVTSQSRQIRGGAFARCTLKPEVSRSEFLARPRISSINFDTVTVMDDHEWERKAFVGTDWEIDSTSGSFRKIGAYYF